MFVYILANRAQRLYVGVTRDLVRRSTTTGHTGSQASRNGTTSTGLFTSNRLQSLLRSDLAEHWFVDVSMSDSSLRSE